MPNQQQKEKPRKGQKAMSQLMKEAARYVIRLSTYKTRGMWIRQKKFFEQPPRPAYLGFGEVGERWANELKLVEADRRFIVEMSYSWGAPTGMILTPIPPRVVDQIPNLTSLERFLSGYWHEDISGSYTWDQLVQASEFTEEELAEAYRDAQFAWSEEGGRGCHGLPGDWWMLEEKAQKLQS